MSKKTGGSTLIQHDSVLTTDGSKDVYALMSRGALIADVPDIIRAIVGMFLDTTSSDQSTIPELDPDGSIDKRLRELNAEIFRVGSEVISLYEQIGVNRNEFIKNNPDDPRCQPQDSFTSLLELLGFGEGAPNPVTASLGAGEFSAN